MVIRGLYGHPAAARRFAKEREEVQSREILSTTKRRSRSGREESDRSFSGRQRNACMIHVRTCSFVKTCME